METFPINFQNYICTSTTIYQIYFGESLSTYKNNTDWTGVVKNFPFNIRKSPTECNFWFKLHFAVKKESHTRVALNLYYNF